MPGHLYPYSSYYLLCARYCTQLYWARAMLLISAAVLTLHECQASVTKTAWFARLHPRDTSSRCTLSSLARLARTRRSLYHIYHPPALKSSNPTLPAPNELRNRLISLLSISPRPTTIVTFMKRLNPSAASTPSVQMSAPPPRSPF